MLDVSTLVQQMHDTLSQIHDTITSLDTKQHDEKLDALEAQRDSVFEQLHAAFQKQREELEQKRKSERDEIAEKRRKEDEEIAARRKQEDEELQTRGQSEDSEHEKKLEEEKKGVETETDSKMEEVEAEAQRLLDEGHKKISELEQKRREINSLIDEQMKAPLPPPPRRRRGTRAAPAQSAPAEPSAPPVQQEASREIAPAESTPAESAPAESAPAESAPAESAPEESAPAESTPVAEPQEESREIVPETSTKEVVPEKALAEESAPVESAPVESAPAESTPTESAPVAEPQEEPREIVPETSTKEVVPEEAPAEESAPEKAESPVPESASQAESAPEETSAKSATHDAEPEEAKQDSGPTEEAPAHEDQPSDIPTQDETKASEDVDEDKKATSNEPEHQEEPTRDHQEVSEATEPEQENDHSSKPEASTAEPPRELQDTTEAAEPKQDEVADQSAKPEADTADEKTGDQDIVHSEEVKTAAESPEHQDEASREPKQETNVAEESKPETVEDNAVKDDSNTSDHHAEPETIAHEEKTVDEPSTSQEESTRGVDSEPTDSKAEAVAEHKASAPSVPEEDASHTEQAPTQTSSTEDASSTPETNAVPAQEEHPTEHRDPSSEGIAKGGAAEEYLKMADAEQEPHHEDSAAASDAVDKSEPEPSSTHEQVDEQVAPQEHASSAEPTETRDLANAEVAEQGDDSKGPVPDESSQTKSEEKPASAHVESDIAPSEAPDRDNNSDESKFGADSTAPVHDEHSSHDKPEDASATAQAEMEAAPTETHDGAKLDDVKEDGNSSTPVHDEKDSAHEPSSETHEEATSDAHEESKPIESQPEADREISKSEAHDTHDSTAQDLGHDQQTSEIMSQDDHVEPVSKSVDSTADSPDQPQADSESGAKSESEPRSEDTNEAKPELTETEPVEAKDAVSSHDEPSSSKENEEHTSTEQSAEPQNLEQKDVSPDDDHRDQNQTKSSLSHESEHKDYDAPGSRDLEGVDGQNPPEDHVDHAEDQAPGDSTQPIVNDHPPADHASMSVPETSEKSDPQQPETTEQVLEGSGNDQAPSRGSDVKDSESHPAEETFDLSGNEPIPGTMTHGVDPEGAEKNLNDGEQLERTTDRGLDTEAPIEKSSDALDNHAEIEKPADLQEGEFHQNGHDAEKEDHHGLDHASENQPHAEVQNATSTDTNEPKEHPSSPKTTSHDQEPASSAGQESSGNPHEESGETLASGTQSITAEHPIEAEHPPPQELGTDQGHSGELTEVKSNVEDSDKPDEHEAPIISVSEHKLEDDARPEGPKPVEGADESSSRDLSQNGPEATAAAQTGDAWEDKHSSDARRPSTIHTDNLHLDDDADAGLFAVPPTPRDEVDQQKPTSLQVSSSSPQTEAGHDEHDASPSLSNQEEETHGAAHVLDSYTHGDEAGAESHAPQDHDEEDRASLPPWLAQKGQPEELPQLQTGLAGRDIDAHDTSSVHSRDGSYHEDFKLSPVAYTPVDKRSRSVESLEQPKAEHGPTDDHEKHAVGNSRPETSSEEHDGTHRDLAQPVDLKERHDAHVDYEHQPFADQGSTSGTVEHMKDSLEGHFDRNVSQDHYNPSTDYSHDQSMEDGHGKDLDEEFTYHQQPTSYASGVNYDGEGYGPSPTEEHHYDAGATAFPRSGHSAYSPGLTGASQSATRSSFSGHDTAGFSYGDDRTETESHTVDTPTISTSLDNDHRSYERAETPEQFHHALGNLPDESAHTVQGTDDLFDDDEDDNSSSDYGEAIVEPTEKIVYQADGSHDNVALGGNHSSLSLGRNSMASQGSYGHRSAGSRSSFGSVRETTPLRVAEGTYLAASPSVVRADWAGDYEDELRRSSRATPQLQPSTGHDTPGISPFALRNTPASGALGEDDRGLAASRWSPRAAARPQTPPSHARQAVADSPQTPSSGTRLGHNNPFRAQQNSDNEEVDPALFMPRDVTNTPWHARNDSIPMSLHSQTTLSSAQDSPIHSSLAVDKHEPVIRDSWPTPAPGYQQYLSGWGGRPRGDSSLSSNNGEYDPFKAESNGSGSVNKSSIYNPFQQRGRAESSVSAAPSAAPSAASASPSRGSGLFHKMRSVFEQGNSGAGEAPSLTRPVSGTYHAANPLRSPARPEQGGRQEEQDYSHRPGY